MFFALHLVKMMADQSGAGVFNSSVIEIEYVNNTPISTSEKIIPAEPEEPDCSGYLIFMYIVLGTIIAAFGITGM